MSLVQGPPGTGKSFVGRAIVKVYLTTYAILFLLTLWFSVGTTSTLRVWVTRIFLAVAERIYHNQIDVPIARIPIPNLLMTWVRA